MHEVIAAFDTIVTDVSISHRLQEPRPMWKWRIPVSSHLCTRFGIRSVGLVTALNRTEQNLVNPYVITVHK